MSTTVKEPGSLILSQQKVNAVNGYLDFLVNGKSKYKTIQDNKALNVFLRIVTGIVTVGTLGTTILAAAAVDGADRVRCYQQNKAINNNVEKVFKTITAAATAEQQGKKYAVESIKEFEVKPAINSLIQSIDKKVGKVGFEKSLALYSDAVKLAETRAANGHLCASLRKDLVSTMTESFYVTLAKKAGAEIAASTPESLDVVKKQAEELSKFAGVTPAAALNEILYAAKVATTPEATAEKIKTLNEANTEISTNKDCKVVQDKVSELKTLKDTKQKELEASAKKLEELRGKLKDANKQIADFMSLTKLTGIDSGRVTNAQKNPDSPDANSLFDGIDFEKIDEKSFGNLINFLKERSQIKKNIVEEEKKFHAIEVDLYFLGVKIDEPDLKVIREDLVKANNDQKAVLEATQKAIESEAFKKANAPKPVSKLEKKDNKQAMLDILSLIRNPLLPAGNKAAAIENAIESLDPSIKTMLLAEVERISIEEKGEAKAAWDTQFAMFRAIANYRGSGVVADYSRLRQAILNIEPKVLVA